MNTIYESPTSIADAIALLSKAELGTARILAGGTDLLAQMRNGLIAPELLIDIKKIPRLGTIERLPDGGFVIGAGVSGIALGEHAELVALLHDLGSGCFDVRINRGDRCGSHK